MDDRTRASLLWGLVGALAFLVLVQGYDLVRAAPLDLPGRFGVAVLVGAVAAALTRRQ